MEEMHRLFHLVGLTDIFLKLKELYIIHNFNQIGIPGIPTSYLMS